MISVVQYRPQWPEEFGVLGKSIRAALGDLAVRIDHIGSTSVPGLAAKDIIDIQVTVRALDGRIERGLRHAGLERLKGRWVDHVPPGQPRSSAEWHKWLFRPAAGQRPANIHVRIAGRLNQRYPLLFRDYLRAHAPVAESYARLKLALARLHADDAEAYYDVKDPACDIIMGGAEDWATTARWKAGPSDG